MLNRRSVLRLIGLGGVAFAAKAAIPKTIDWAVAEPLIVTPEVLAPAAIPLSLQWMTMEMVKALERCVDAHRGPWQDVRMSHQAGIDFVSDDWGTTPLAGKDFSMRYLLPSASALARQVPRGSRFGDLDLPVAVEDSAFVRSAESGIAVRGIRAYSAMTDQMLTRFDVLVGN